MEINYSLEAYKELEARFNKTALHRPMRIRRYEAGTELVYDVVGVAQEDRATVHLTVEKFVGGGFAGQVYRVKVLDISPEQSAIASLKRGGIYAMKILIPPGGFARFFRNTLYWIGFQGPFQLQVNPSASRSGALWQKFIRRGAKVWFGREDAVVDIYATFVDACLGSCGELSEWVEGRTWRLEADEHLDALKRWIKGKRVDETTLGSPEYRAKREFMHRFVDLLHHMGAHEFARQYEWSTCKSQPNCLKRKHTDNSPSEGLVAVDFRAGLALLPFLPMSPGDFKLILKGILRGSLVQFDRGSIRTLEAFIHNHPNAFADMYPLLEELKAAENTYRNSTPDIAHHHFRLFFSRRLWSTILTSAVTGWKVTNLISEKREEKFRNHPISTLLFAVLGFIPLLGRLLRRIWGHAYWRRHYSAILTNYNYFKRAIRAKSIESSIDWLRAGRIEEKKALQITKHVWRYACHLPLSFLPAGFHRFLTDWPYAKEKFDYLLVRPVRLYFNNDLREQWLRDMITEGKENYLLTNEDADVILSQIKEPFIQKYLKNLAVHVCTLPVTQVVSVLVAMIYVLTHPEMPRAQAYGIGLGIIALFQVVPISPGSLARGLYVLYLVIRERNFKDYNIAVFLGFFKYIGYLAFPIQMTYRYPALARFMAGHWATEAVHIVPVFGERGALLEHGIFNLFYNWPLTIRRRMRNRSRIRAALKPRYWHVIPCVIVGTGLFTFVDLSYLNTSGSLPGLREIWWFAILLSGGCGVVVTLGAGGANMGKRVLGSVLCSAAIAILSTAILPLFLNDHSMAAAQITVSCIWRVFLTAIFSVVGLLITEIKLPAQ